MRVAKYSRTLLMLALPVVPAACALAQEHPNVQPSAVRDLINKSAGGPQLQAAAAGKAPARPVGSPQAPAVAAQAPAAPPAGNLANQKGSAVRRDPFETLLSASRPGTGVPENLPPGKAGLMVGTLRIDGIVRGSGGMIAIVSNPQQRVYFLREGDKLYDGSVEHITLEAISFREFGKDAFGKPLERQVTRRLYPSSGEQR